MKTIKNILLGLLLVSVFNSCQNLTHIIPSKNVTIQDKFIENYDRVEVSTAFNVDIQFSTATESIEIEANENLHQYIEVEKVNNILRIRLQNGVSIQGNSTLKAHIITKNPLNYYYASGASIISLKNNLIADNVTISLSGASNFSGSVIATSISSQLDGASIINFHGSAENLQVIASGASMVSDYDMVTQDASINLSGASQANLTINRTINVSVSGASILRYKGSGVITDINVSDASQVVKMN